MPSGAYGCPGIPHDIDKLFGVGSYWLAASNYQNIFCSKPNSLSARANVAFQFDKPSLVTKVVQLGTFYGPVVLMLSDTMFTGSFHTQLEEKAIYFDTYTSA